MPLNNKILKPFQKQYRAPVFIETGTHKGDGVQSALDAGFLRVYSVELHPGLAQKAQLRFAADSRVDIEQGHSADGLKRILQAIHCDVVFWLDAHEGVGADDPCPVLRELDAIAEHPIKHHTILVDDVRLFGTDKFGGVTLDQVKARILEINPEYGFTLIDSARFGKDILVAVVRRVRDPMCPRKLSKAEHALCADRCISAEAAAVRAMDAIAADTSLSIVRMADGERAIIERGRGNTDPHSRFLARPDWCKRYGIAGIDLVQLGKDMLWAGQHTDYLAIPLIGIWLGTYNMHQYFPTRKFIDQWYHREWAAIGRAKTILSSAPVMFCQRNADVLAKRIESNLKIPPMQPFRLDSWKDHDRLTDAVANTKAKIILLCGGPSSKPLNVRLARRFNKIVIDGGHEVVARWGA